MSRSLDSRRAALHSLFEGEIVERSTGRLSAQTRSYLSRETRARSVIQLLEGGPQVGAAPGLILETVRREAMRPALFAYLLSRGRDDLAQALWSNPAFTSSPAAEMASMLFSTLLAPSSSSPAVEQAARWLHALDERFGIVSPDRLQQLVAWADRPYAVGESIAAEQEVLARSLALFRGMNAEMLRQVWGVSRAAATDRGTGEQEMETRLLRHPACDLTLLQEVLRKSRWSPSLSVAAAGHPSIWSSSGYVPALMASGGADAVLALARSAPPEGFRSLFLRLRAQRAGDALGLLRESPERARWLVRDDVVPLLSSDEAEVRLEAIRLLPSLGFSTQVEEMDPDERARTRRRRG